MYTYAHCFLGEGYFAFQILRLVAIMHCTMSNVCPIACYMLFKHISCAQMISHFHMFVGFQ